MRVFNVQRVVLVGAISLAVVACGGDAVEGDDSTTSSSLVGSVETTVVTISPSTTVASTTSTVAASTTTLLPPVDADVVPLESVIGGTIRGEGWLVEPGNYSAELGSFRYTFTLTEPVVYFESEARITFGPDTSSSVTDMFLLTHFAGVIPADRAGVHAPHDPVVPSYTSPVPENLGTWLSSVTQFSPGNQLDVATDTGVTARAWDVGVDGSVGGSFNCPWGTCVSALVSEAEGVYVLFEESTFRIWQFTGPNDGVHGFLQSRPDTFGDMIDLADMVVGGMIVEQVG